MPEKELKRLLRKRGLSATNANKLLKGKNRTKKKGWIRTASRELSINFHHNSMWWTLWLTPHEWNSSIPKWRSGSIDFLDLLRGKEKVTRKEKEINNDILDMTEGKYHFRVKEIERKKEYSRWYTNIFKRYDFEFGYEDENNNFIETPIIKWGKGENSWDCGMDGTYSFSIPVNNRTYQELKEYVKDSILKERKRRGEIDFSNIELKDGFVIENLINKF